MRVGCPKSAISRHYRTDCRCIDRELPSSANTHARIEDMDDDPSAVRLEATLDSLYEVSHPNFPAPRGIAMTYYHGREHAPFVFTGLPLWAWTITDAQGLVDFVLQDLWGLTRSGPSVNRASTSGVPTRRAAPARRSSAEPR